ncbi:gfo/Idh/MocA family oxidoreductase [Pseudorhizobium endolithicum]|uniref:Gfo/Idh/MocA family oxidoreductase n=1 Tax=Pseudorhizobium endolithicum TaxID=1191678 RepID=A0ABM8PLX4_9HYPH|nr:Gfo/Idh/MocA family oxidoreductase [Pseudorhizobium endolithicum]CAD7037156.1 gfo/Idh/MocA family oxidoreductase [Pseudorhizobium endolithicum]
MTFSVVLCGCGAMAKGWLRALQSDLELASGFKIIGLVDLDRVAAERLAAEFGLSPVVIGADLRSMLEEAQPDAVFDIVIPQARQAVVETCLSFGCHVLSEKPMGASLQDAQSLVRAAAQAGRIHAVVQNRRFNSGVRRMRRMVEEGLLGDLTAIHCDFFIAPHFGGFREQMDHVLLLDMAVHTFDAARFVAGSSPQSVYCLETNPKGSWYAHGASANAIFHFSDDVIFTYRGSWCAEGERTSWESLWRVVGTKGMATWDGEEDIKASIAGEEPGLLRGSLPIDVPQPRHQRETHGHASVLSDFLTALKTGRSPETVGSDNIKSLAMVFGAIESAKTGRAVDLTSQGTSHA